MLGRDAELVARERGHEPIPMPRAALDITDVAAVDRVVSTARPEVILNCAAWTDVDGAEDNEAAASAINDAGAAHLAGAADAYGAAIVHVSSDYVFDGSATYPYPEDAPTGAIGAYGRTKEAGEAAVTASNPRHIIARACWLYGVGGHNFVETMLRLAENQPEVLVVSDQTGTPTYTRHLAGALIELAEGDAWGIHHLPAAGSCSWYDFAQEIFDMTGSDCRVMAGTTEMLGRKAPRPAYSVLGVTRPETPRLPSWQDGLREYLAERPQS
jgi:dTDP-4-dehydrorhamnose reductase